MKDQDIRKVLLGSLKGEHYEDPDTLIIEELGLCQGQARIDIAVVNGSIHGYEIKSDSDTLERLPRQQDIYSRILNQVTLITSSRYIDKAEIIIPKWWGISEVFYDNDDLKIRQIRKAGNNNNIDPKAVVQLLWKNEALEILKERGIQKGIITKPRQVLWNRIVEHVTIDDLCFEIRNRIKMRENWRLDLPQT